MVSEQSILEMTKDLLANFKKMVGDLRSVQSELRSLKENFQDVKEMLKEHEVLEDYEDDKEFQREFTGERSSDLLFNNNDKESATIPMDNKPDQEGMGSQPNPDPEKYPIPKSDQNRSPGLNLNLNPKSDPISSRDLNWKPKSLSSQLSWSSSSIPSPLVSFAVDGTPTVVVSSIVDQNTSDRKGSYENKKIERSSASKPKPNLVISIRPKPKPNFCSIKSASLKAYGRDGSGNDRRKLPRYHSQRSLSSALKPLRFIHEFILSWTKIKSVGEPPPLLPLAPTEELELRETHQRGHVKGNSVVGLINPRMMKVEGINEQRILLKDSGATDNYILKELVSKMKPPTKGSREYGIIWETDVTIKEGICRGVRVYMQGIKVVEESLPVELGNSDLILGVRRLQNLDTIDTNRKTQFMNATGNRMGEIWIQHKCQGSIQQDIFLYHDKLVIPHTLSMISFCFEEFDVH